MDRCLQPFNRDRDRTADAEDCNFKQGSDLWQRSLKR